MEDLKEIITGTELGSNSIPAIEINNYKKKNKEKIIRKIANMDLPTGDWKEIKKEIIKGKGKY